MQKLIINTDNPFENAKRYVPVYMFLTGFMVALMTISKGLKACVGLEINSEQSVLLRRYRRFSDATGYYLTASGKDWP